NWAVLVAPFTQERRSPTLSQSGTKSVAWSGWRGDGDEHQNILRMTEDAREARTLWGSWPDERQSISAVAVSTASLRNSHMEVCMQRLRLILLAVSILSLLGNPAVARTITVHPGDSIRSALSVARSGDRVQVLPGVYHE